MNDSEEWVKLRKTIELLHKIQEFEKEQRKYYDTRILP